jgi:hypothetical protein
MFSGRSGLPFPSAFFISAIVVPKDGAVPEALNFSKNARFRGERIQKETLPGMLTGWQCAK